MMVVVVVVVVMVGGLAQLGSGTTTSCDTTALVQQCTFPSACDDVAAFSACATQLGCQDNTLVQQALDAYTNCFASPLPQDSPELRVVNQTMYLEAPNDIVLTIGGESEQTLTISQLVDAVETLPTLATRQQVDDVNATLQLAQEALRSEIDDAAGLINSTVASRFASMETVFHNSFATIDASLDQVYQHVADVNATIASEIGHLWQKIVQKHGEALEAAGDVSSELSTYMDGVDTTIGTLAGQVANLQTFKDTTVPDIETMQGQIEDLLETKEEFDAFKKVGQRFPARMSIWGRGQGGGEGEVGCRMFSFFFGLMFVLMHICKASLTCSCVVCLCLVCVCLCTAALDARYQCRFACKDVR